MLFCRRCCQCFVAVDVVVNGFVVVRVAVAFIVVIIVDVTVNIVLVVVIVGSRNIILK